MSSRQSFRTRLSDVNRRYVVVYLVLTVLAIAYLTPLWSGVLTAVKTLDALSRTLPFSPPGPGGFTFEPIAVAFGVLAPSMINSLLFTVPATILSGFLGSFAAYGLTIVEWRGQTGLVVLFVAAIFLPSQAILIPLSRFWAIVDLHSVLAHLGPINVWQLPFMKEHYVAIIQLIVTHTAFGLGITTLLFRSHYLKMDADIIESARVDGASITSIYRRIVFPLSIPMFAVVFIFQFTTIWNEFLYGLVLTGGGNASPATVALNELSSGFAQRYNHLNAGAFLVALPTLIVYVLFGKQFVRGVAAEVETD